MPREELPRTSILLVQRISFLWKGRNAQQPHQQQLPQFGVDVAIAPRASSRARVFHWLTFSRRESFVPTRRFRHCVLVRAVGVVERIEAVARVAVSKFFRDLRAVNRYRVRVALPRTLAGRDLPTGRVPEDEERNTYHPRIHLEQTLPYCLGHIGSEHYRAGRADVKYFVFSYNFPEREELNDADHVVFVNKLPQPLWRNGHKRDHSRDEAVGERVFKLSRERRLEPEADTHEAAARACDGGGSHHRDRNVCITVLIFLLKMFLGNALLFRI